jgi:hypothetical protein
MTRDARYDRTARLADLEDRVGALERVNVERGIGRPSTKQAQAIRFMVENQDVIAQMIEQYRATVDRTVN